MPLVSIILPTFNRARFIPEALASIAKQSMSSWELVVVDDGSTDATRQIVEQYNGVTQSIRYVFQENRGAYAARNTGLDSATGDYVAFFDSDDLWLPDYLDRCVAALDNHPELDWVYTACRSVDESSGAVLAPSTFYVNGRRRAFLDLPARPSGELRILEPSDALTGQLASGLYAGLQNSLIRRRVFDAGRFWDDYRVVEDVLFLIRALNRGIRVGYIDDVLVVYRVHSDNSSGSAHAPGAGQLLAIYEEETRGLERLRDEVALPPEAETLLLRSLGAKYFWRLGYAGYWQSGRRSEALRAFRMGLRLSGLDWRMWKTYALCRLRTLGATDTDTIG